MTDIVSYMVVVFAIGFGFGAFFTVGLYSFIFKQDKTNDDESKNQKIDLK